MEDKENTEERQEPAKSVRELKLAIGAYFGTRLTFYAHMLSLDSGFPPCSPWSPWFTKLTLVENVGLTAEAGMSNIVGHGAPTTGPRQ